MFSEKYEKMVLECIEIIKEWPNLTEEEIEHYIEQAKEAPPKKLRSLLVWRKPEQT